ncbi:extracellular solute-binding protein [Rubritalea spongiae]|uniref:Extracellular solute-binding protein n=1 Tax=Rubritalea spongiae TaxID=430797 RepID=A0ABW5E9M6_9BACT
MKFAKYILLGIVIALVTAGCGERESAADHELGFDAFVPQYNASVNQWLSDQIRAIDQQLEQVRSELEKSQDAAARQMFEDKLADLENELNKHQRRLDHGEYFSFKSLEDLPAGLVWEDGMDNPEIGDPRAQKGGVFRNYIPNFPETLRPFGKNSNHAFRGSLYDEIGMGLVGLHPITNKFIPALAKEWALGADGRTVFYRLDPDARYSNGEKVRAKDFMVACYIRLSDNVSAPFQKQYYRAQIANVTVYSEDTLSISLPEKKPLLPLYANLSPAPPGFYKEYGPDYAERYQWKVEPTTGAYTALPEDVKKGKSISLTRVKDWWAKDKKFYKYSNNVDRIHYQVVREPSKAFELFRVGELDTFSLGEPSYWYDKMEIPEYFNGYIVKAQFYNVYPRVPRGFYLNAYDSKLADINVRRGIAHAMNFQKVNTILFRGDAERAQQFSEGFDEFTNPNIKAREYSIEKAREYFAEAGYTRSDNEGYLINNQGQRLEVEFSWATSIPLWNQMMALLSEDAKKAGLKMLLDGQQPSVNFKKLLEKRHQVGFLGWGVSPPFPRYFQFFHSSTAFDEKGNPKQQTNNMTLYTSEKLDELTKTERNATDLDILKKASWEIQQIVHDQVLYIPGLMTTYSRMAYWDWIKWPQTKLYEFSSPKVYYPVENYLYWIDPKAKERVLEARRKRAVLEEKNYVFDLYRDGVPPLEELEKRKSRAVK